MTVDRLRALAVTAFPSSPTRAAIFAEFDRLVAFLTSEKVCCELRTDGSFLTEKNDPDDIDLSFSAWANHLDTLDPNLQISLFQNLNGNKVYSPVLDTYFCARFTRDDPRRPADQTDYWARKWGVGWDGYLKGYAAIKLGESDVGLRLFA